ATAHPAVAGARAAGDCGIHDRAVAPSGLAHCPGSVAMSVGYTTVQWNRHKVVYDRCVVGAVLFYLAIFFLVGRLVWTGRNAISPPILLMRAFGTCAFLMLNLILCIGPLCRLSRRFLPLLYNRRHLGVATFLVALCHAVLVLGFYHGFGRVNPFV